MRLVKVGDFVKYTTNYSSKGIAYEVIVRVDKVEGGATSYYESYQGTVVLSNIKNFPIGKITRGFNKDLDKSHWGKVEVL